MKLYEVKISKSLKSIEDKFRQVVMDLTHVYPHVARKGDIYRFGPKPENVKFTKGKSHEFGNDFSGTPPYIDVRRWEMPGSQGRELYIEALIHFDPKVLAAAAKADQINIAVHNALGRFGTVTQYGKKIGHKHGAGNRYLTTSYVQV